MGRGSPLPRVWELHMVAALWVSTAHPVDSGTYGLNGLGSGPPVAHQADSRGGDMDMGMPRRRPSPYPPPEKLWVTVT